MRLSLSEIQDWRRFEMLVTDYLKKIGESTKNNISDVEVRLSGKGSDGGTDIFATLKISDTISSHRKKWLVQCKFVEKNISKSHLATVNIPSLIHEHGADGYLFVCKNDISSKVTEMFENLRNNCRFGYRYEIWTGEDLLKNIADRQDLLKHYFPKFSNFTNRVD